MMGNEMAKALLSMPKVCAYLFPYVCSYVRPYMCVSLYGIYALLSMPKACAYMLQAQGHTPKARRRT